MQRSLHLLTIGIAGLLSVALAACNQPSGGSKSAAGGESFSLDGHATSIMLQSNARDASTGRDARALLGFTGTLTATNLTSPGDSQTIPWAVTVDDATLAVNSTTTGVLFPGTYNFELEVSRGSQTYFGRVEGVTIGEGENAFALTLRPVIRDTDVDGFVAERLVDLRFAYDPAELSVLANPQIGIAVDGGSEQIFALDPDTGLSEFMHLDLPPGMHTLELTAYDGNVLRGRSVAAQETVDLQPGVPVTMDLVSLHGDVIIALDETTNDVTFNFDVPTEVVDEAGGLADLHTLLNVVGPANPAGHEVELGLAESGTSYAGSATLGGFQFGAVTVMLTFSDRNGTADLADDEVLGSCTIAGVTLSSDGSTVACPITLRRRAVVGGHLLAVVGVNVYDQQGFPVEGVVVSLDGEVVGVTGSMAFGTSGYLKFFTVPQDGAVIEGLSAESFKTGAATVDLAPLSVNNVALTLDTDYLNLMANVLPNCDDCEFEVGLPFGFPFFGTAYGAVGISTNGYLTFDRLDGATNGSDFTPDPIPQLDSVNNMIAGAWTDLNPNQGGAISYETQGTAPNRLFVVQYDLLPWYGLGDTPRVTMQVLLFEGTNVSQVHVLHQDDYASHGGGVTANTYTQGVENAAGTLAAFLAGRNNQDYALSFDAVEFATTAGGATATPISYDPAP